MEASALQSKQKAWKGPKNLNKNMLACKRRQKTTHDFLSSISRNLLTEKFESTFGAPIGRTF
jgi:hypothetical protein